MKSIRRFSVLSATVVAILAFAVSARGGDGAPDAAGSTGATPPQEITAIDFDRANFGASTTVDNKWFPLKPGTQLVYRGTTEGEKIAHRVVFTVTDLTKEIDGVRNVVLWDRDYSAGELVEAEIAFFA